jgi:protoporphyrinogen/coproporphyrinogen III oxidase
MRVVVAGGGITGLTAAYSLVRAGAAVTIVESSSMLGGKVATERVDGFTIERGPDSFLTLRPAGLALCREVGLGDDVMPPLDPDAVFVWHGDRLVPIPSGTGLGIPTRFTPFLASSLFSPREKLRAALEPVVPRQARGGDVAIGPFLRHRFGGAVVERLAGPFIGGIYGASIDELSLDALMPRLRDAVDRYGSLVRAGLAARTSRRTTLPSPQVVTLRRGMGSLVDAITRHLERADVLLGVDLDVVERAGSRFVARLRDGTRIAADAVVLATPAAAAARALRELAPGASDALATITYRGTAAVSLAYDERHLPRPMGHGFLVPDGALPIAACTWSSSKWADRAPNGAVLIRATIRSDALLARDEKELIGAAHRSVARTMRAVGEPMLARVSLWAGAMPRYTVGHLDRLARIGAALLPLPAIALAGAAYRGAGVPDCIAQGQAAAAQILSVEGAVA